MELGPIRLSWTANTEPDLAGYKIYFGRASRVYTAAGSPIDVGNVTTYVMTIAEDGFWYFTITAYDTSANESSPLVGTEVAVEFLRHQGSRTANHAIYRLAHR